LIFVVICFVQGHIGYRVYQFCSGLGFPSTKRLAKLQIHAGEEWDLVSEKEALLGDFHYLPWKEIWLTPTLFGSCQVNIKHG
jgi:hypothetical protein